MESSSSIFDISTGDLINQDCHVIKEYNTIVVYYKDNPIRSSFYKDWNKTIKQLEKRLEENSVPQFTISQILACMSKNYEKLMVGGSSSSSESETSPSSTDNPFERLDGMSLVEWHTTSTKKYQELYDKVRSSRIPQLWLPLDFALSIKTILNIDDCTLPLAGILLAVPSSLKTVVIELFRPYWRAYYTDHFSPKSFVSHSTNVMTEKDLEKIDMLPKIKNRFLLTPELAPIFTANEDDLKQMFGIITRILDGKGYQSNSGAHGQRGYQGDHMFVWLGAAVEISPRVHRMMGNLGPKMYYLRLPKTNKTEYDLLQQLKDNRFQKDVDGIREALFDYLKWFEACPIMKEKNGLPKMEWDASKDDIKALRYIARLAKLLAQLRGIVETWETQGSQGSDYSYKLPIIEEPDRATTQLYNLARGHALSSGRNYVTMEDIPLIAKVVLSTAPIERVAVFDLLLANKGTLRTADIKDGLYLSKPIALKTMTEFAVLRLVDGEKDGESDNSPKVITLRNEFKWCLGRSFRQLREGFTPARGERKRAKKRKQKPHLDTSKIFHSFEHERLFWKMYDKLESQKLPDSGNDKITTTVSETLLKQALISSGKYQAGDATQTVKDLINHRILKKLDFDVLCKNSQSEVSKNEGEM